MNNILPVFDATEFDNSQLEYFLDNAQDRIRNLWDRRESAQWDGDEQRAERCEDLIADYEQRMDIIETELTLRKQ